MNESSYLENLARRIEEAARLKNPVPRLFKIADEIRQYKDKRYNGGEMEEFMLDRVYE
jgi:hypothetical protein